MSAQSVSDAVSGQRTTTGLTSWIQRHPLVSFFVLAYLITWSLDLAPARDPLASILVTLGGFGPAAAAIIVSAIAGGRAAVGRMLARLGYWRSSPGWYLIALLAPFVLLAVAAAAAAAAGWVSLTGATPGRLYLLPVYYVLGGLLFGPLGEEPGWRGFALPRMLERAGAVPAALLLGLIWGLWHLPLFITPGTNQHNMLHYLRVPPALIVATYVVSVIAMSVVIAWVCLRTRGSLLMATMTHTSLNTAAVGVPMLLSLTRYQPITLLYFVLLIPAGMALLPALQRSQPMPAEPARPARTQTRT